MTNTRGIGLYFHWPFCAKKCPYCDFNTHVHDTIDQEAWKKSYLRAIDHYAEILPDAHIVSVFFGGGTPSLMPPDTVAAMIAAARSKWKFADDAEITLEANPTSVEADKFKAFRAAGVNRVSLGVQSLKDTDLQFLGRAHSASEALKAIDIARDVFDRTSFDLIYARPAQTLKDWETELNDAVKHTNGHLSLYQLTIERSTPFYMEHAKKKFTMPDDSLAADFYNLTQDILEKAGLPAYEVSNHASPGQESRHNLIYWHYGDYIGIGPGAHGRLTLDGVKNATREHSAPGIWLERVTEHGHGAHPFQPIAPRDRFFEALMMGLRVRGGVALDHLRMVSGMESTEMLDETKLQSARLQGWLAEDTERLRPTREGWLRLNALVPYILSS